MQPDQVKIFFDAWAVGIMILWGIAVKYFPPLAKVPNFVIGWTNVIGYIFVQLSAGAAQAAGIKDVLPDIGGILVGSLTNAGWAMVLYETVGRSFLEKLLKLKKAVPIIK